MVNSSIQRSDILNNRIKNDFLGSINNCSFGVNTIPLITSSRRLYVLSEKFKQPKIL